MGCLGWYDVIKCSKSVHLESGGFLLTQFSGLDMVFLTCDATHLPRDVIDVLSMNVAHRATQQHSQSQVIASLKHFGKCG